MLNTEVPLFCPRKDCPYYQATKNTILKDGTYRIESDTVRRQMFYCCGGGHRFAETAYSDLWGKHGSYKEYVQTAKLTTYGLSSDQIADVLDKDPRTIQQWQEAIGEKSKRLHQYLCQIIGLVLAVLQLDELWSYLQNKRKQLWAFLALEAQSKFWLAFELGARTRQTAGRLLNTVQSFVRLSDQTVIKVTTDKLAAYRHALAEHFRDRSYVYLQIVKRRFKRRLVTVKKFFVKGGESDFPDKTQNTAFIERLNLTLRQRVCYLARKTLGYCKSKPRFRCVLWINLFSYNYCRWHKSLRRDVIGKAVSFTRRYEQYTPAMKMGLTNARLDWKYLFLVPIPSRE